MNQMQRWALRKACQWAIMFQYTLFKMNLIYCRKIVSLLETLCKVSNVFVTLEEKAGSLIVHAQV